jgi:kynurenine formamidase
VKLIDLSQPFGPAINDTLGSAEIMVEIVPLKSVEEDGVHARQFILGGHAGTHVDAPLHVLPGGASIADIPLSRFFGPAAVLDVRKEPNEAITCDDIGAAAHLRDGDIVFLETGWSRYAGTSAYRESHPYLDPAAVECLVRRKVKAVGIDASSLDMPRSIRPPDFHHETLAALFRAGVPAIHGLVNLELVRGQRCTAVAFPIVFEGSDAGPARVIAIVDEGDDPEAQ